MTVRATRTHLRPLSPASWTLALVTAAFASSCHPAAGGDPEFWAPLPGAGGASGVTGSSSATGPVMSTTSGSEPNTAASSGSGDPTTGSTGTGSQPAGTPKLTVDFTTVTFDGEYAPRNVGAVWITDEQGVFVKTLEKWAVKRSKYLVKWKAASGGSTVDAVTGATRAQHGAHSLEWDATDADGKLVPDGVYRIYLEFTEKNGAGPWTAIEVVKGSSPADVAPADLANFIGQHVTYTP